MGWGGSIPFRRRESMGCKGGWSGDAPTAWCPAYIRVINITRAKAHVHVANCVILSYLNSPLPPWYKRSHLPNPHRWFFCNIIFFHVSSRRPRESDPMTRAPPSRGRLSVANPPLQIGCYVTAPTIEDSKGTRNERRRENLTRKTRRDARETGRKHDERTHASRPPRRPHAAGGGGGGEKYAASLVTSMPAMLALDRVLRMPVMSAETARRLTSPEREGEIWERTPIWVPREPMLPKPQRA